MRPAARITVGIVALTWLASACTLDHVGLSVGGEAPDVARVDVVTALDATDVPGLDVVADERPDVVVPADAMDAMDAMDANDVQMPDVQMPDVQMPDVQPDVQMPDVQTPDVQPDVPSTIVPPGGACVPGTGLCAPGSQCLMFTGGGGTPAATVCAICGGAGQRKCAAGVICRAGTTPDNVSGLCIPGDIDTRCGGAGGACMSHDPYIMCSDCGGMNLRCLSTGAGIPPACAVCGNAGNPCCCGTGAAACACDPGLACSGGGAGGYNVCH